MDAIVSGLRSTFYTGRTKSFAFREMQLKALRLLVSENSEKISSALYQDLGKCKAESFMLEADLVETEITDTLKHLQSWMKPEYVSKTLLFQAMTCYTQKEPFGVALVIGAWNYPIQLTLIPLVGAIAAGNCAIIKPSEVSPNTADLLAELIPRYLDNDCYQVVKGGIPETTELLEQKFDMIFYTGNSQVARIVMTAAAKHLTPVLLELGGKSPVYVDESADLSIAAKRIVWGKFMNCGQTCVAPDFIMCPENTIDRLLENLKAATEQFYGTDIKNCVDYGKIVNAKHFDRISKFLEEENVDVIYGGEKDRDSLYIAPTLVKNPRQDSKLLNEEIFGPILPVFAIEDDDAAIFYINERPKPLSLYVFTSKAPIIEKFRVRTSSGMFVANDTVVQGGLNTLPFGGVGESGLGRYHGKFSFDAYSHNKSCMEVPGKLVEGAYNRMRYPPYDEKKVSWARWILAGKGGNSSCNIL